MIGIYGGTFDPIHHGHLRVALELYERLKLDEVRLIPSARPPHRDMPSTPAELRLAMVQAAVADMPKLIADDCEIRREGRSYMVDTLQDLRQTLGNDVSLCLLIGMDAFISLDRWHRWDELINLTHLVIVQRPGSTLQLNTTLRAFFERHFIDSLQVLHYMPYGGVFMQTTPGLNISSTAIREMLVTGRDPKYLLPDAVLEIIQQNRLYQRNDN